MQIKLQDSALTQGLSCESQEWFRNTKCSFKSLESLGSCLENRQAAVVNISYANLLNAMLGAELLSDQPDAMDTADSAWSQVLSTIHSRLWFLPLPPLSSPAFCGHCFLPLLLISGQCELWPPMQLLWVCGLADSLQMSLLSKLQPISLALHRSSAVHAVEKITQSSSMCSFPIFFFMHLATLPVSQT